MIQYPSIQGSKHAELGRNVHAFRKYDGSNLRWEWTKKKGFWKFGTRNRLFDERDQQFGDAVDLFFDQYAEPLERIIHDNYKNKLRVVVFTEYHGPNSFAGNHEPDDPKQLTLFDVHVKTRGLIPPEEFIQMFGDLDFSQELVHQGEITTDFIHWVQNNPELGEGVICKDQDWYCKIKTNQYMDRLKQEFGVQWVNHWE